MSQKSINSDEYEPIDTLVVGAGLVGMATAAACAVRPGNAGKALVREKGPSHSYRDSTPSQGSLRGSRVAEQTVELTADIRSTWERIGELEKKHGLIIQRPASMATPYLMLVKNAEHFQGMQQDLAHKGSKFTAYAPGEAERHFKIHLPQGYAGVINTLESRTLDIDAYFTALQREIKERRGEILFNASIRDYGKLKSGDHLIELEDGRKYRTKHLVVAAGTDIGPTLQELKRLHGKALSARPQEFEAECDIPPRFRPEASIRVPQRTLHIVFEGDGVRPLTLYNLDIDRTIPLADGKEEKHIGNLGFYMFPERIQDKQGVMRDGLKIGYDPMGSSIDNERILDRQQELMLDHVSKTYGVPREKMHIVKSHSCAYPVDAVHYPCMGESTFHGVGIAANFIGYGAMAAYGAAERMVKEGIPRESRYHPDTIPRTQELALFGSYYGPQQTFPQPPSAGLPYGVGTSERVR